MNVNVNGRQLNFTNRYGSVIPWASHPDELNKQSLHALNQWDLAGALKYAQESIKYTATPIAYDMMAVVYYQYGMTAEYHKTISDGLTLFPTSTNLLFQRGLMELNQGQWEVGFRDCEYRDTRIVHITNLAKVAKGLPEWNMMPCNKILVLGEHGLGDQICFARYLPMIRQFAKSVTFLTQTPLKRFFTECGLANEVIDSDAPINPGEFDCWIGLESLPFLMSSTPVPVYPLQPVEPSTHIKRIGICWKGSPTPEPHRSMTWKEFSPIANVPGYEFVSLQYKTECPDKKVEAPVIGDLQDMSEVMNTLDAVVSVDTCVAHLAATKGIETFVLRSLPHEWRWGNGQSAWWYPKTRVFFQQERGEWKYPVEAVCEVLTNINL